MCLGNIVLLYTFLSMLLEKKTISVLQVPCLLIFLANNVNMNNRLLYIDFRVAIFPEGSMNKRCPRPLCHAATHHFTSVSLLPMSRMPLAVFLKVLLQKQIFPVFFPLKKHSN